MFIMNIAAGPATPVTVQLPMSNFFNTRSVAPAFVGIRFLATGEIQRRAADGSWSTVANWLVSGTAANFYLLSQIQGGFPGTLTSDDGRGPLQMNATRSFSIENPATESNRDIFMNFQISDDSLGSNIVVEKAHYMSVSVSDVFD